MVSISSTCKGRPDDSRLRSSPSTQASPTPSPSLPPIFVMRGLFNADGDCSLLPGRPWLPRTCSRNTRFAPRPAELRFLLTTVGSPRRRSSKPPLRTCASQAGPDHSARACATAHAAVHTRGIHSSLTIFIDLAYTRRNSASSGGTIASS